MRSLVIIALFVVASSTVYAEPESLFEYVGPASAANLPAHTRAAQSVRINRRALQSPTISIDLFGEQVVAVRDRVERHKAGVLVWIGHLTGSPGDSVIVTVRGSASSGMIQRGPEMYRIGGAPGGGNRLFDIDLRSLPPEDLEGLPDGFGSSSSGGASGTTAADNTVQDLLVAYTQAACNYAGGCSQLEADITTAVADINVAYAESGVNLTMNLAATAFVNYAEPGSASTTLNDLAGKNDGKMDELHQLRDSSGADLVALVYNGPGCGIGYISSSATTAFSVTDVPCLVGNRTMAHEIGHNQGAHHDRVTVGGGSNGSYNYGYRRCNDGSSDDFGSPYFRTVLAYPCTSSPRVGRFSNPDVNYLGVPQGVDPSVTPAKAAWNARTINESASYIAGFRTATTQVTPPAAPSGLAATAAGYDIINLAWLDNSTDETQFVLESSLDDVNWSVIAILNADVTNHVDNGLQPNTNYRYRVKAQNSAGNSGYSNAASATTASPPASIDDLAAGEISTKGAVNGTYADTHLDDSVAQTITEASSGGPKRSRKQSFSHTWTFDVAGGAGGVVVTANAWVSGGEGANFQYSTDLGTTWNQMFTVDKTSTATIMTFMLPGTTAGTLWIEATDAAQTNGEGVDTLSVDYLVITSQTQAGTPPTAPTAMSVTGASSNSVSLSYMDNADNEFGFEIRRSTADPAFNCAAASVIETIGANAGTGSMTYVDTTAAPATTYWYWATAFNGAGTGDVCSNAATATTLPGSTISASANGYKIKGVHHANVAWSGASGTNVDIRRNGSLVATTENDGLYSDNIGNKGAGTYSYEVCETGSTTSCSAPVNVTF